MREHMCGTCLLALSIQDRRMEGLEAGNGLCFYFHIGNERSKLHSTFFTGKEHYTV